MLVLSRHTNEFIDIDGGFKANGVSIVVVEILGNRVKLGIAAPKDVPVNRREIALLKRSTPEQEAHIRRQLKNRIPLHRIEQMLDDEENRERTDG